MKIGIDIRLFAESGNGRYIRNIVREISKLDDTNQYALFCLSKDIDSVKSLLGESKKFKYEIVCADIRWYTFKEQIIFPFLLYKQNLDLIHFPHFNVPVLYFKNFVVTIHDLTHFSFSMQQSSTLPPIFYYIKKLAYNISFNYAVNFSKKIITVSDFVKKDLIKKFNISVEKIAVIYEAAEVPIQLSELTKDILFGKYNISKPYFFYVGNAHPHKNINFLIESFVEFNKNNNYQLVLSGKDSYFWRGVREFVCSRRYENIIFTGLVSETELANLYTRAVAYVFPSLSEGFGLPILEAMSYGCPVICSNSTSLPEIGGKAVYYIDPLQKNSLVSAFEKLSNDSTLREQLINLGKMRYAKFNWSDSGIKTREVYLH